jgi:hypothetical protein
MAIETRLALHLVPGAVIGGVRRVSVAHLEVTRREMLLMTAPFLLPMAENRVPVGACEGGVLRIFYSNDVQVVMCPVGAPFPVCE